MAAKPFTQEELAKYKEIFDHMDSDKDGKISHADLKRCLDEAGWGLNDDEIAAIIKKADQDGSGTISWEEFLKVAEQRPIRRRIEAALRRMFRAMDVDGTGYITKDNLKQLLVEVGAGDEVPDSELDAMIKRADKTGSGKVSFEEFVEAFLNR